MSNGPVRLQLAKMRAAAILEQAGITTLPVDPFEIAKKHEIVVEPKPDTGEGVSGMLLRYGETFGIMYATHIASEGFQKFSIAHELGHYFLEGHIDHIFRNDGSIHTSHAGFVSGDNYELEADHFAVGLLMPQRLFKNALVKYSPGLVAIESLANICSTSLTASAIRYAELTNDAIAVIMTTGSRVDYCFLSDTMKLLKDLSWPRKGSTIPHGTLTAEFNRSPNRVLRLEKDSSEIDIQDWLGGRRSLSAIEEIIGLGTYGKTLTVLTCSLDDDEIYTDEDEDEDLVESWTPRFRR